MKKNFLEHKEIFSRIYTTGEWGGGSGDGSLPNNTESYRLLLASFIQKNNIKTVFDFGCGDWNFSRFIDWSNVNYTGIECVKLLVDNHNNFYKKDNINFIHLENAELFYSYKGDLLILKDVLQHWRNEEIIDFLDNAIKNFKFILITNSSSQIKDWQDEPDRSRPLSCNYYPLKKYNIEKLLILKDVDAAGDKEISLISSTEYSNIITGNRFKNLCDDYIDESKPFIDLSKKPSKIFLYTDWLSLFTQKVLPKINYPFTLVTHNSDQKITQDNIDILNNVNLKKWFGMNCFLTHKKLQPIPIGIANEKWPHGNKDELLQVSNTDINRKNFVYSNFEVTTNFYKRSEVLNELKSKDFITFDFNKHSFLNYLKEVKSYKYIISPWGNGVDCHRIWESIMLGTIPIIEKHIALEYFYDLPVYIVDSFNQLNREDLEKNYNKLLKKNKNKAMFSYYKNLINEELV